MLSYMDAFKFVWILQYNFNKYVQLKNYTKTSDRNKII